jgi:hypothetical protein
VCKSGERRKRDRDVNPNSILVNIQQVFWCKQFQRSVTTGIIVVKGPVSCWDLHISLQGKRAR